MYPTALNDPSSHIVSENPRIDNLPLTGLTCRRIRRIIEMMHIDTINDCLARLDVLHAVEDYDVLPGGISGSYLYRLRFASGSAVLKVTLATCEAYVRQRALREFELYHTLSGCIPLKLPHLLSSYTDPDFGTCILLEAYQPPEPPAAWKQADYLQVAEQLARLHARFWGKEEMSFEHTWLRHPRSKTSKNEIRLAQQAWRTLSQQQRLDQVFNAPSCQWLCDKLEEIHAIDAMISSFPVTLCHGDCHTGNLLRNAEGKLVWADWQEVGLGRGPQDLSFLFQRALYGGGDVPYESATVAYQESLEVELGQRISLASIERVIEGNELRTLLLQWPFYLEQAPADQIATMLERVMELA